jgi:CheY-like chemotaxis protein
LPQVVFLGLVLPDGEGAQLRGLIRVLPQMGKVQIYAVTGYPEEYALRSADAPMDGYFLKPMKPSRLVELVGDARSDGGA